MLKIVICDDEVIFTETMKEALAENLDYTDCNVNIPVIQTERTFCKKSARQNRKTSRI